MSINKCTSSVFLALLLLTLVDLSSCAGPVARPGPRPAPQATIPGRPLPPESASPPATVPAPEMPAPGDLEVGPSRGPTPRTVASLRLTDQARALLESGKADEAIRTLERAVNLNPSNGENFYYLSEAWLMKGNLLQAKEFNRLAGLHLKRDAGWTARVEEQAERIRKGVGNKP